MSNDQSGVIFQRVTVPTVQDFAIPAFSVSGYPQTSLASKESKIPTWMHDYLFSHENEKDNMFSNSSAVVIEFYPFKNVAHGTEWRIKGLVGWISIRLDTRAYDALTATGSLEGMRTDGLFVNRSNFK